MAAVLEQLVPVCAAESDLVRPLYLSNRPSGSGTHSQTAISVADIQTLVLAVLPLVSEISRLDHRHRDGMHRDFSARDCSD